MIHEMRLHPEHFQRIKSGSKTIEARVYDEKRQNIRKGDTIVFTNRKDLQEQVEAEVDGISIFPSFAELFITYPITSFGWLEGTGVDEVIKEMREYYSEEEETKFGVIGIHLTVH